MTKKWLSITEDIFRERKLVKVGNCVPYIFDSVSTFVIQFWDRHHFGWGGFLLERKSRFSKTVDRVEYYGWIQDRIICRKMSEKVIASYCCIMATVLRIFP